VGIPEMDPSFQMRLANTKQRGRIISLDLLAMLCLTQPRRLLAAFSSRAHCWLEFLEGFFFYISVKVLAKTVTSML